MSDLYDALTEISGVGEARAEEIVDLVEQHYDGDSSDIEDAARDALDKLQEGHPSHAQGHLESVLED